MSSQASSRILAACLPALLASLAIGAESDFKFSFGSRPAPPGYLKVASPAGYSAETGYGFENNARPAVTETSCTSEKPFAFSVKVPEGNYLVTATLGDEKRASVTTIKAEARRPMVAKVETAPGKFETRSFVVNIRDPKITGDGSVKLNQRELGPPVVAHWDDKLTVEFNNAHPALSTLVLTNVDSLPTLYLAGDSTVTDQAAEPWAGWGQLLPLFFKPDLAVANYAESGRTLRSFQGDKRLEKLLSTFQSGDYLFIQFGHNDQKEKGEGVGAFTTYKASLKHYIDEAKKRGGHPVLVTSMNRRRFGADGKVEQTLGDYPEAVRQTATEEGVPLIDLNAMSKDLYEAFGPEESKKLFVHYPAGTFPGQDKELKDDTHHNVYGAYELARCMVEGIKARVPDLAKHLRPDIPKFDPGHPDTLESVALPASPSAATEKPAGS